MNSLKIKVYERVLKEVSEKYEGTEQLMNSRIDKICPQEKLFAEGVKSFISIIFFLMYRSKYFCFCYLGLRLFCLLKYFDCKLTLLSLESEV